MQTPHADVLAASVRERPAKRIRKAPNKGTKVPAATGALGQPGETKRQRLNPPEVSTEQHDATGFSTDQQKAEAILKRIEAILPRVGKKRIDSPAILQELHQVFPGFKIIQLIAGKGTDRRFEPQKKSLLKKHHIEDQSCDFVKINKSFSMIHGKSMTYFPKGS